MPVEENAVFGCAEDCLRWGRRYVAPRAEWKVLVGFWRFDDGVGVFELVCGGLGWKIADGLIFG